MFGTLLQKPFQWLRGAARFKTLWLGGPLLLYGWTLTGPFLSDDLHLMLKAERYLRGESQALDLFRFARSDDEWRELRNQGSCAWWQPDGWRPDYVRPIASGSFLLDVFVFGRNPFGYRLVSLGVFAIALVCVHWLFRQATDDPVRPGVATFLFGISQGLVQPVTWLSSRSDLLVVIGVSLAAGAYWAAYRRPSLKWGLLAVAAFAFALFSKEVAVALAAVIGMHEWVRRRHPGPVQPNRATSWIAAVLATMAIAFIAYYIHSRPWILSPPHGDGGPAQSGMRILQALLLYASVWTTGYPIDTFLLGASRWHLWTVATVGGLLLLVTIGYMRRSTRGDRAALFFVLWAPALLLPGLGGMTTTNRVMCAATVGWAFLLAGLIVPRREADAAPLFLRHFLFAANTTVSIGCVIGTVLVMNHAEWRARDRLAGVVAELDSSLSDGDTLLVRESRGPLEISCGAERLELLTGRRHVALTYLLPPDVEGEWQRVDPRTVIVRARDGGLFNTLLYESSSGHDSRAPAGETFRLRGFTIEVEETGEGDDFTVLALRFTEPLSSPRMHLVPPPVGPKATSTVAKTGDP
ncbi:MAG: hypothetical protein ACE5F9_14730 [Phycisphaerae bacterium]